MTGYIHSTESFGTVDGPGIRFVIFMQGCPLRCKYCHNPDTWELRQGTEMTSDELIALYQKNKAFYSKGGITVTGGEPLLQMDFVTELFALAKREGIHTCLDTSGSIMNDSVKALLKVTDRVLLDIKYTTDELYKKHAGCSLQSVIDFLDYLNEEKIPVTLRQVIIPTLNDNEENVIELKKIADAHPCVDKIELLPFRKICKVKYDKMGIDFPFDHIPEPSAETMTKLKNIL